MSVGIKHESCRLCLERQGLITGRLVEDGKQTHTQRVDLQVGEEKFLVQVEKANDEVGQNPAEANKVFSVLQC